jgi:hypothetical protein
MRSARYSEQRQLRRKRHRRGHLKTKVGFGDLQRVNSGLARAKAQGNKLGHPCRDTPKRLAAIRRLRKRGLGINKIARKLGIGVSVVQRVVSK